jgi:DNA helicase-2/ATP-dependent DNA helicase PcrA
VTVFRPRTGQSDVLAYTSGRIGIRAVPGSGKTRTLAELAARLVAERVGDDQEVLVVTLVNSAVDNFKLRINEAIRERGLLAGFGYRVRTLHGLAHDIVRERPGLVGLSEDFGIIDERDATTVREEAADAWLRAHPEIVDNYLSPALEGNQAEWARREKWPSLVRDVAAAFIKQAKDMQLTPEMLLEGLARHESGWHGSAGAAPMSLARLGTEIYADYQRSLAYRGVVDFDDLIRLALKAIKLDTDYLARLQQRWPYVLEDEAQDSSRVQEEILRLLVSGSGNWVRVGDPNQAIYDTFTNADPRFLRDYLREPGVREIELPESGRSQPAIIELANYLVTWSRADHHLPAGRGAFTASQIEPTGPGDPQPNPPEDIAAVQPVDRRFSPEAELRAVADSLQHWLPSHQDRTVAVLVPRNKRGADLADILKQRGIPYVELLRSTNVTRQTAGAIAILLRCLADPTSPRKLAKAFEVWRRGDRDEPDAKALVDRIARRIRGCLAVEAYLWPRADHDWLGSELLSPDEEYLLEQFREMARRWHRAATLPVDQLILTLAGDLFYEPPELALAHKLAALLRDVSSVHPSFRLAELVEELVVIARNERRFLGFSSEDSGFEPPAGLVTVTTMHKAKGLEWDRVYLISVNSYDFPSGMGNETYIAEPWFVRDGLNLQAEALAQLEALASLLKNGSGTGSVVEGWATQQARLGYIAERLRLLYVGITRARRDLILTWNSGRRGDLQMSAPFIALHGYWQGRTGNELEPAD